MSEPVQWFLLLLFAAHLAGFTLLGLRRREWYYLALITTFALLTASFALLLFAPAVSIAELPVYRLTRYAAWLAAALSISWSLKRLRARLWGNGR